VSSGSKAKAWPPSSASSPQVDGSSGSSGVEQALNKPEPATTATLLKRKNSRRPKGDVMFSPKRPARRLIEWGRIDSKELIIPGFSAALYRHSKNALMVANLKERRAYQRQP
jgi:hypothetical protein